MRRSFRNRSAGAPRSGSDREFAFRSSRSVLSPPRYGKRHAPYRGGFERCSSRRARAAGEKARASRPRVVGPMTGLPTCTSYFGRMISARDFCAIPAADGMFGICGPVRGRLRRRSGFRVAIGLSDDGGTGFRRKFFPAPYGCRSTDRHAASAVCLGSEIFPAECSAEAGSYFQNKLSTNSLRSKACNWSIPSPTPMKRTGILNWSLMPITTPPLAVPSSFVMASEVTCVAWVNCLAC